MSNCLEETACGRNSSDVPLINNRARDHVAHYCNCLTILVTQVEIDQETIKYCNDGLFRSASRWPGCGVNLTKGSQFQSIEICQDVRGGLCGLIARLCLEPDQSPVLFHLPPPLPLSAPVLKQCYDSERGAMVTVIVQSSQNEREKVVWYSTITCTADCHLAVTIVPSHFGSYNSTITFWRLQ